MKKLEPYNPADFETIATLGERVTVPDGKRGAFHVFTHELDEWYNLDQEAEARATFDEFAETYGSARLYFQVEDETTDELDLEECWESVGEFPL